MILDSDLLRDVRAGVQKVADSGQYGSTFYIFRYGDKVQTVSNKNQGIGKLIETVTATPKAEPTPEHGIGGSEPADYSVQYEGTGKL